MSWRIAFSWGGSTALGVLLVVGLGSCKREGAASAQSDAASAPDVASPSTDHVAGDAAGSEVAAASQGAAAAGAPPPTVAPAPLPTPDLAGACDPQTPAGKGVATSVGVLASPAAPIAGRPLTIVAATLESELPLAVRVERDGKPIEAEAAFRPGVPSATLLTLQIDEPATLTVVVGRAGEALSCTTIKVGKSAPQHPRRARSEGTWPVTRAWTGAEEALFSSWVRELFTAPRGDDLAWKALHEVTSDPSRNLLHNSFGWSEDSADTKQGLYLKPDCADAPYFLRAYYAWKRGLPFAFRQCSRGSGKAPRCGSIHGVVGTPEHEPDASKPGELGGVQRYFRRTLAWGVHSGNGRTAFGDDDTDFYPLALERRALRPGMIYADPYGHIFVLVELMPPQGSLPGVLYAIDGQPDGSITRKRFWEGNFLFNPDPALGGSGFKGFRPLEVKRDGGVPTLVAAGDAAILKLPGYGDVSDAQAKLTAPQFYDRMDALITPGPRDPLKAQSEAIQALFEAAKVRVTSVDNGTEHVAKSGATVDMPEGHAIFETTGAWENYSTPARDLRLLIAIDLVRGFDDKVARNAAVFLREGETIAQLREKLSAARAALLADPKFEFEYGRTDGSKWRLSVDDLMTRAEAFEVAYNPNDCPEVRWGAPAGSEEAKTCKARAPALQQRKMNAYRPWFTRRQRPGRGDPGPHVQ